MFYPNVYVHLWNQPRHRQTIEEGGTTEAPGGKLIWRCRDCYVVLLQKFRNNNINVFRNVLYWFTKIKHICFQRNRMTFQKPTAFVLMKEQLRYWLQTSAVQQFPKYQKYRISQIPKYNLCLFRFRANIRKAVICL